ncbi:MAG: DUF421 domain-containing protein [Chitinophagaceae bacterium]|nr:MAG: DUF421 domain-containing protein [Chitinophagaceae bacterium]
MFLLQSKPFSWRDLLLGSENWPFLWETVLRTLIMFIIIMISLRLLGKRGVKQLSVFELVVIIGLGSAAGDPMFYKDVGILPSLIVFVMIIGLYSGITYLIGKSKKFENLVEGKPICLIKDGVFEIENFKKEALGEDEFFAELRLQGVSQLGQIDQAIEESNGGISIFYFEDEDVKYGLPILPGTLDEAVKEISEAGHYACIFCGYTMEVKEASKPVCPTCQKKEWVKASKRRRVG